MAPHIFVVQPIPEPALEIMRAVAEVEVYPYTDRQITVGELAEAVRRSDYLYTMHETIVSEDVLRANPDLKGIGLGGSEFREMIDVDACEKAGIPLIFHDEADHSVSRASNAKATADLTLTMVLNLAYRVVEADAYTRGGGFRQEMTMDLMGVGCAGRTAGLIGLGVVARELVPRLRALDMDVAYTKRTRLDHDDESALGVRWVESLHELLPQCDSVCMMARYSPPAQMLMGEAEFALMKPTAHFVNTARGRLVDEPAMIRALENGTIAGAGLDVFWNEPPVVHDPFVPHALRKLDNVVLAPHNGGATWDSRANETVAVAKALVKAIEMAAAPAR